MTNYNNQEIVPGILPEPNELAGENSTEQIEEGLAAAKNFEQEEAEQTAELKNNKAKPFKTIGGSNTNNNNFWEWKSYSSPHNSITGHKIISRAAGRLGGGDNTEYWHEHPLTEKYNQPKGGYGSGEWCAAFASWCWKTANVSPYWKWTASAGGFIVKHGGYNPKFYWPAIGMAVVFDYNPSEQYAKHVAIASGVRMWQRKRNGPRQIEIKIIQGNDIHGEVGYGACRAYIYPNKTRNGWYTPPITVTKHPGEPKLTVSGYVPFEWSLLR